MGEIGGNRTVETRLQHSFFDFPSFVRLCGHVIPRFKLINLLALSTTYVLCVYFRL